VRFCAFCQLFLADFVIVGDFRCVLGLCGGSFLDVSATFSNFRWVLAPLEIFASFGGFERVLEGLS